MKAIKEEKKYTVEVFEAIDGTRFSDREECEVYERSAKCLLLSKYNKLVVNKSPEYSIFGCGSEEDCIDIIELSCKEDIDVIMQTIGVIHPSMLNESNKKSYDKYYNTLIKAYEENDSDREE